MPLYGWSGPGKMREMDLARTKAPEIVMPTTVSLVKEPVKVFKCTECGKKFKKGVFHGADVANEGESRLVGADGRG